MQTELVQDMMNPDLIERAKNLTSDIIKLNTIEDQLISQRAKINWIKLDDGNNAFFHASMKSKQQMNHIKSLKNKDGIILTTHHELEDEILHFYGELVGKSNHRMDNITMIAMRQGAHLNVDQR